MFSLHARQSTCDHIVQKHGCDWRGCSDFDIVCRLLCTVDASFRRRREHSGQPGKRRVKHMRVRTRIALADEVHDRESIVQDESVRMSVCRDAHWKPKTYFLTAMSTYHSRETVSSSIASDGSVEKLGARSKSGSGSATILLRFAVGAVILRVF